MLRSEDKINKIKNDVLERLKLADNNNRVDDKYTQRDTNWWKAYRYDIRELLGVIDDYEETLSKLANPP
jgi:hypothetical protein